MVSEILAITAISIVNGILLLVSYVTNNSFPQPLTEEEESKYLILLGQRDESARSVLIERNLRLVAHIVKKFDSAGENNDDLISIGTIGLIKGINTYDKGKGTRLATYAARCIENEILMHLRTIKKNRQEVSLYDPIGIDKEGNEITLIDVLGTDPEVVSEMVENSFEQRRLIDKIKKLNNREKRVLEMRFGLFNSLRRTQREIAKRLGI